MVVVRIGWCSGREHQRGGMNQAPQAIRHVIIRGRVQQVGFRAWTEDTALEHGLEGWVRNRRDGAVEAVFAGPAEAVAGGSLPAGPARGTCRRGRSA